MLLPPISFASDAALTSSKLCINAQSESIAQEKLNVAHCKGLDHRNFWVRLNLVAGDGYSTGAETEGRNL